MSSTCPCARPAKCPCPNDDPNFTKVLKDIHLVKDGTPEERSNLFMVCILVRTLLYSGVYVYREASWMPYMVAILALASIIQLTKPTKNTQWWSKKFQLVMAILVLISALAVKFAKFDSRSMSALLFISLIGGVLQRTQIKMC